MDSTAIQTIADNLGMAVSSTEQFIQDILPQYAMMEVSSDIPFLISFGVIIVVSIIGLIICGKKMYIGYKDEDEDAFDWVVGIVIASFFLIIFGIFFMIALVDVIQWTFFPEAKFFDCVMSCLK